MHARPPRSANRTTAPAASSPARPLTTVDVVIFTVLDGELQLLLVQRPPSPGEPFPGRWALPGGDVDVARDATLLACARRKLKETTGVTSTYLEQLGSWGSRERDPRGWSATHVYFALVPAVGVKPAAGGPDSPVRWAAVDAVQTHRGLAFDHGDLVDAAVARLRSKVEYTSLPAFLLPEPFTLPQLQRTYEVVLGRPVDKSGFRTRTLAADFLEEAGVVEGGSNRPAAAYRLRDRERAVTFPRTFSPRA